MKPIILLLITFFFLNDSLLLFADPIDSSALGGETASVSTSSLQKPLSAPERSALSIRLANVTGKKAPFTTLKEFYSSAEGLMLTEDFKIIESISVFTKNDIPLLQNMFKAMSVLDGIDSSRTRTLETLSVIIEKNKDILLKAAETIKNTKTKKTALELIEIAKEPYEN